MRSAVIAPDPHETSQRSDHAPAVTSVHAAGTQAGLDLRRVHGQQLQAFTAAALPLGIPVVTS